MGLIGGVPYIGPEAQRGTAGAVRHAGLSRRGVIVRCRLQGEVVQELAQDSG